MHASSNDSARLAPPNDYDCLLFSTLLLLTRFRTPRDSFDLPPRPPISKRTTGCIVDMSPLIEEENSSGINRGYKSRGMNTEWRRSRDDASFGKRSTHVRDFVLCNRPNVTCRVTRLSRKNVKIKRFVSLTDFKNLTYSLFLSSNKNIITYHSQSRPAKSAPRFHTN